MLKNLPSRERGSIAQTNYNLQRDQAPKEDQLHYDGSDYRTYRGQKKKKKNFLKMNCFYLQIFFFFMKSVNYDASQDSVLG